VRIVFAGTPDLAVPTLSALLGSRHDVALVITQPDRPAGRGRRLVAPPMKELALSVKAPVIQPESINRSDAVQQIRASAPDAIVVFAYGKRLAHRVLRLPRLACFNIHASLLPKYRGAAPINHAILNGETETGVTVQRMAETIDTGAIVAQRSVLIGEEETAGQLAERLAALAAEMIVPTLNAIEAGAVEERSQDPALATEAPLLRKSDGVIPWNRSAGEVCNFVRAMTPWPGAFTFHQTAGGEMRGRVVLLAARAVADPGREAKHAVGPVARPGVIVRADQGDGCGSVSPRPCRTRRRPVP